MSFAEVQREDRDFGSARRTAAHDRRVTGGTFSISNGGVVSGSMLSTPI